MWNCLLFNRKAKQVAWVLLTTTIMGFMLILEYFWTQNVEMLAGTASLIVWFVYIFKMPQKDKTTTLMAGEMNVDRLHIDFQNKNMSHPTQLRNRSVESLVEVCVDGGSRHPVGFPSNAAKQDHPPLPHADPVYLSSLPLPLIPPYEGGERRRTYRAFLKPLPFCADSEAGDDKTYWLEDLQLKNYEKRLIAYGLWLNDRIINAAMKLMAVEAESKYVTINGLSDVVLSSICGYKPKYPMSNFIQILNIRGNHWICISDVFSTRDSEVIIYDSDQASSFGLLGCVMCYPSSVVQAAHSFLQPRQNDVTMSVAVVQQQEEEDDCGLFAIAFAGMLFQKKDPVLFRFKQSAMRESLISSLQTKDIAKFVNNIMDGPSGVDKNPILYQWKSPKAKDKVGTSGHRRRPKLGKCDRSHGKKEWLEMKSIAIPMETIIKPPEEFR